MEEIKKILEQSLVDLYKNDSYLIHNNGQDETLNHRLAIYIEKHFTKKASNNIYQVDLDYNPIRNSTKSVSENPIRSGISIHKRGSNKHNYLYLTAKKNYLDSVDTEEFQNTLNQLKKPYNYKYSCLIEYLPEENFFTLLIAEKIQSKHKTEVFFIKKPVV